MLPRFALLALLPLLGAPLSAQLSPPSGTAPTVVILVRHAEAANDGTSDPPLSETGRRRAEAWLASLRDVPLAGVHTTPLRRTTETAQQVAAGRGMALRVYDPADLEALAESLTAEGGTHLVVGHSNTTPALVRALGGSPGAAIAESEHDRLYIVFIEPGRGAARTLQLRLPPA